MSQIKSHAQRRQKRHRTLRKKIQGTTTRPRLCVFRSARHIYAQVVDDLKGHTLAAASTRDRELQAQLKDKNGGNQAAATQVGALVASRWIEKGGKKVVFDRGGHRFHGRVRALAEAARQAGLEF